MNVPAPAAPVDVVVPVHDEAAEVVVRTVAEVLAGFDAATIPVRVFVVDDGSDPPLAPPSADPRVTLLRHAQNRGYGASLKTGIRAGDSPRIGMVDADATYPARRLAELALHADADQVLGVRTTKVNGTPLLRRPAKWALNRFAAYLTSTPVPDINTGLRVVSRELVTGCWALLPERYSFVSTLTLAAIGGGYTTRHVPIDYYPRQGRSGISPLQDTVRFFRIVLRLGMLVSPARTFTPLAAVLLGVGLAKGVAIDWWREGHVGVLAAVLMVGAVQLWCLGLLGELIVASWRLLGRAPPTGRDRTSR